MATDAEKRRALLALVFASPEATTQLIHECHTDAEVAAWIAREKRCSAEDAARIAPVLREALAEMTPEGAARAAVRRRQEAP